MLRRQPAAPGFEEREQSTLCSVFTVSRLHTLENGHANQPFLGLPHVFLCLRLDERQFDEHTRLNTLDLLGDGLDHAIGHVLEHHRL